MSCFIAATAAFDFVGSLKNICLQDFHIPRGIVGICL
jgi:hypothetical protein